MTSLETGAEFLGARLIGRRYAYYACEIHAWIWVPRAELETLGRAVLADEPDAYSLWCAATRTRIMARRTVARAGL